MNPFVVLYNFIVRAISPLLALVAKHAGNAFYLYLAAVVSVLIVADAAGPQIEAKMQHGAFDFMMRYRILVPKPDPDIVIVDINEASLAAMAREYGRWPWPRQVLGEFLENLEAQRPKAVIFDILFSDPDIYNPDSDAYFDAAVAATDNSYFPYLRLGSASDPLSKVRPAMIPGVVPIPGQAQENATIAVVLPHFTSILRGGRLGLHTIYPDADGVVREYTVYRNDYGWKFPSLPSRIVRDLGLSEPAVPSVLLNWRGVPFSYRTVTFSDVYNDMLSKNKNRAQDEFTGKIVLVGSTAPSLFDVKPTPMSTLHPGVEILATAIDNLKHGDYLRFPEGRIVYPLVAIILVWTIGLAIFRDPQGERTDRVVGTFEFILFGVSYASINLSHTYINLTGPFTVVLGYYALARIYGVATRKILETSVLRDSTERQGTLGAVLLIIRPAKPSQYTLQHIRSRVLKLGTEPKSVETLDGRQKGIWSLFEGMLVVSWIFPAQDEEAHGRIVRDVKIITASLPKALRQPADKGDNAPAWITHEGRISAGASAPEGWRALFSEAQLRWHFQGGLAHHE